MDWITRLKECKSCAERRRVFRERMDQIKATLGLKTDQQAAEFVRAEQREAAKKESTSA